VSALGKDWHVDCFACVQCKEPFTKIGGQYVLHKDQPYCPTHYRELFGQRCAGCNQLIEGPAIKADDLLYHPTCLTCETCHKPFDSGKFYVAEGKRYCKEHIPRTARPMCYKCGGDIKGKYLRLKGDIAVHFDCHVCATCQVKLDGEYINVNGVSFCSGTCAAKAANPTTGETPVVPEEPPRTSSPKISQEEYQDAFKNHSEPMEQNPNAEVTSMPLESRIAELSDSTLNPEDSSNTVLGNHSIMSRNESDPETLAKSMESIILEQRMERFSRENSSKKNLNSSHSGNEIVKSSSLGT